MREIFNHMQNLFRIPFALSFRNPAMISILYQ